MFQLNRLFATIDQTGSRQDSSVYQLGLVLALFLFITLISGVAALHGVNWLRSVGIIALTGVLGLAIGALMGFLFGLPKTAMRPVTASAGSPSTGAQMPGPTPTGRLLNTNTNLEELSDWLTKIIVGIGLVQLGQINKYLLQFEDEVARFNGDGDKLVPLCAVFVLCTCAIMGFLWMYLEARTFLTRLLGDAEASLNALLSSAIDRISNSAGVKDSAMAPAASALKAAAEIKPEDASLRSAAVKALVVSGRIADAAAILSTGPATSLDDQLSKMFVALYRPPDGYIEAISISDGLINNPAANLKGDFWFYRAAALGQKYAALQAQPTPSANDLAATKSAILDAAQKAMALDVNFKARLFSLAHPPANSDDDDLASLATDPDFMALVS